LAASDFTNALFHSVAHGLVGVKLGLLRQVTNFDARHGNGFALDFLVDAGHDFQEVDLPEPFRPSTPILAPGKKLSEMSFRICRLGGTILHTRFMEKTYWAMDLRRPIGGGEAISLKNGMRVRRGVRRQVRPPFSRDYRRFENASSAPAENQRSLAHVDALATT
jgi:hypothetical protein